MGNSFSEKMYEIQDRQKREFNERVGIILQHIDNLGFAKKQEQARADMQHNYQAITGDTKGVPANYNGTEAGYYENKINAFHKDKEKELWQTDGYEENKDLSFSQNKQKYQEHKQVLDNNKKTVRSLLQELNLLGVSDDYKDDSNNPNGRYDEERIESLQKKIYDTKYNNYLEKSFDTHILRATEKEADPEKRYRKMTTMQIEHDEDKKDKRQMKKRFDNAYRKMMKIPELREEMQKVGVNENSEDKIADYYKLEEIQAKYNIAAEKSKKMTEIYSKNAGLLSEIEESRTLLNRIEEIELMSKTEQKKAFAQLLEELYEDPEVRESTSLATLKGIEQGNLKRLESEAKYKGANIPSTKKNENDTNKDTKNQGGIESIM